MLRKINKMIDKIHIIMQKKTTILIEQIDLIDVWRHTHKNKSEFTWRSNKNPPILSRLD